MKTLVLILTLFLVGCQKNAKSPDPTPEPQKTTSAVSCTAPSGLTDINWKPVLSGYINIMFASSGTYYESNYNNQGTWSFACSDSIKIQKQNWKVNYRIVSLTNDTLKLMDAVYFINVYHK